MSANYLKLLSSMDKLPIYTDIDTLNIYCEYLLNDSSKYINYANLTNLNDYISRMDTKLLLTNDSKMARYEFIKYYLEARIKKGVISRKMTLKYVMENVDRRYHKIIQREILNSITPDTLKKTDIEFINDMIFSQLNVIFLQAYKAPISRLVEDLDTGEFGKTSDDCTSAIQLFQSLLNELTKAQRRSKQDNRFNLTDENHFNAIMSEAWSRLLSDSQYWQTGMQGLNNMLGGGFENGRLYNFIGATGGFKSGLLLNLMKSIKLHNRGHEHKDPNKRPTVLFLSQENNIWETILRIFNIFGTTQSIRNFTAQEIMEILAKGGFRLVQDDLDLDIEFRYYGNMDIGAADIRGIVEELDNQGREVICVLQDYIERLKPPNFAADRRIQLNDISNQLHDLAIELDIPIITGSQLNREGVSVIEDMKTSEKHDIGMRMGTKYISESFGMLKNIDVNIAIVVEYDSTEKRFWLSFRKLKFRGDDTGLLDYFLQPFVGENSKIMLMEDINTEPVFRRTMLGGIDASIEDETMKLETAVRTRSILEPILDDADDRAIADFIQDFESDMKKPLAQNKDGEFRDKDGFIQLIRKPGRTKHQIYPHTTYTDDEMLSPRKRSSMITDDMIMIT